MRQIQPGTGESPVFFFITLIKLYLLCSFLHTLTYCIKEVIKGRIFWRSNEKSVGLWGTHRPKQDNTLQFFSKPWFNCICFVYFYIFDLLYQRGYQRQYFGHWNLNLLAYDAATAWNREIPCKILKLLI